MRLSEMRVESDSNASAVSYDQYQQDHLDQKMSFVGSVSLAAAIIQVLLMWVDLFQLLESEARVSIVLMRVSLSVMMLVFSYLCFKKRIQSFRIYTRWVTVLEALSVLTFLHIFRMYDPPDFAIQSMGLMVILMVILVIPNHLSYTLIVSAVSVFSYLIMARVVLDSTLTLNEFWAGAFYLLATLMLCSTFAFILNKHRYLEYQAKKRLERISSLDQLTQIPNRNHLIETWRLWSEHGRLSDQPIVLALMDVDRFKEINDQNGHLAADQALVRLVSLIRSQLRTTDLVARWGGDEFVLLLRNLNKREAFHIIQRIQMNMQTSLQVNDIKLSCSFGLASTRESDTFDTLIHLADMRMYLAKKKGGNQIVFESDLPGCSSDDPNANML